MESRMMGGDVESRKGKNTDAKVRQEKNGTVIGREGA